MNDEEYRLSEIRQIALTVNDVRHELWTAFVRDPDGNLVGLMEERR